MTQNGPVPNVVLVFMDDMGYGDMGCMGGTVIRTPNMDRVAERGITFRHMYSAAPSCTPSRAALMTGRYAQRVGLPRVVFPDWPEGISDWEITVAELLRENGYRTAAYGKWHLGSAPHHAPTLHGFDEFFGMRYSNDMDPVWLFDGAQVVEESVDQAMVTRQYTDKAIDFIDRHADGPFFVYLAHTMPHIPLHVEPPFRGTSRAGTYGDTIECIDHHLGRILDHLDETGLAENTLILVTSDNGPWFEGSTGGLRGRKGTAYEGGIRMPFAAQWPARIPAGSVTDEPACFVDLLPTLVALAGGKVPADRPIDGIDIGPVLCGDAMPAREEPIYFFRDWTLNSLRFGPWKLHVSRQPNQDERELPQLFDLHGDPTESYDVGNLHPEVLADLVARAQDFALQIEQQRPAAEARALGRPQPAA